MKEHPTACKVGAFLTGFALGGVGGGLGVSEIEKAPVTDGEKAAGAGAGAAVGGLLGMIIGHYVCQPEEAMAAAPPPPPPPPAPLPKGTKVAEIPGPNFEFDKASLTAEGRAKVDEAAQILKDHPSNSVEIAGHTDSVGSDAYNQRLSERRANTVAERLVADGISRSRLHVRGYGESRPVASNKSAEGRARNRRVEIVTD